VDPALGGPLRIGPVRPAGAGAGTGAVVVATDALLAHLERIERLCADLAGDARGVAALPPIPMPVALGAALDPGLRHAASHAPAALALRRATALADRARHGLRTAIERYGAAEAEQHARMVVLGEGLGAALGPAIRTILLLGLPAVLGARAAGLLSDAQLGALRRWFLDNPGLITSPEFVEAVRAGAMGMDEALSTAAGAPPDTLERVAASHGFTGVQAGAVGVLGVAVPLGLFREGPVSVERVSTLPLLTGPRGAAERLARVPEGDQVRIERYEAPGSPPRYVVYVGPTETFSPVAAREPWDLTSNVTGVAGMPAGSLRATEAAMRQAGIAATDEVQFVGFSQGGLVAARLAASGEWNAAGLETYGAPTGNVRLPEWLAGMAVRNSDDFIPALAGPQLDHGLLQVERRAFAADSAIPDELPAPAHQRSAYVATATEIDAARSAAVRVQVAAMDAFTADYASRDGARVTVMTFHAVRGAERGMGPGHPAPEQLIANGPTS